MVSEANTPSKTDVKGHDILCQKIASEIVYIFACSYLCLLEDVTNFLPPCMMNRTEKLFTRHAHDIEFWFLGPAKEMEMYHGHYPA